MSEEYTISNKRIAQFKAAFETTQTMYARMQDLEAARADARNRVDEELEAAAAQIEADLDRDMEAAGIDPDDDTPVGPTFAVFADAWAKVYADLNPRRKFLPDENGMIAFPIHPDSPLAMGDPVAAAIADLPMVVPGVTVLINPRNLPPAPETPVTPEMIAAARNAPGIRGGYNADERIFTAIYRAMDAHRPVEFVPETRIAELEAERDERIAAYQDLMDIALEHRDLIAARDARIRELDDLLAQRPEPVPDTQKPVHDWTRVEGGDRRMLGR